MNERRHLDRDLPIRERILLTSEADERSQVELIEDISAIPELDDVLLVVMNEIQSTRHPLDFTQSLIERVQLAPEADESSLRAMVAEISAKDAEQLAAEILGQAVGEVDPSVVEDVGRLLDTCLNQIQINLESIEAVARLNTEREASNG